MMMQVATFAR